MHTREVKGRPLKKQMLFLSYFAYHIIMTVRYFYAGATYLDYLHQEGFQELNTTSGRKKHFKLPLTYLGL